jgi:electron transport complex protein RnfB
VRTVPIDLAVPLNASVGTYDRVRDFITSQELIGLADCICRKKDELIGKKCSRPHETCMSFGDTARYYIDYNMARQISRDEALRVLDLGEKSALVVCPTNTVEHAGICLCCSCCCGTLSGMRLLPNPAEHMHSTYQARIDPGLCNSCGVCLDRCQMLAIKEEDSSFAVDPKRCIGCGLCVPTCPVNAVALQKKEGDDRPQGNFLDLLQRISRERGIPDGA